MVLNSGKISYPLSSDTKHIYLFTANSVVTSNGKLVMGAGVAKAVRDTYKGIDTLFGSKIVHMDVFCLQFVEWNGVWIGAFQTKIDWREASPLNVVQSSINMLTSVANKRPNHTFHLPCPAVNHGGRRIEDILPMLESLPDNVIVYLNK